MKYFLLLAAGLTLACGKAETTESEFVQYTGSIEVLAQGTRSETVILEDFDTGERFALVGDTARELVRQYGNTVTVTAVHTEEGWSMRPELRKLEVVEYILMEPEMERDE